VTGLDVVALEGSVRDSLATLKDVGGVVGSFVCTPDGRLVSREIPAMFDDGALAEAGSRLIRFREAFAAGGDDLEVGVIRFDEHRIYMKVVGNSLLMILVQGAVNMPALRMAANLVTRRIGPAVAQVESEPTIRYPPAPPPEVAPPVRAPRFAAEAPPGMRRFRGRAVD
jgi:predicted regulator of Ras-like GTPase activity (Roadblock/LC7/MglB family)